MMPNISMDVSTILANDSSWGVALTTEAALNIEKPYWMNVLDKATVIIMTCNIVFLMLGMGAATHITEVWRNMKRPWGCIIGMVCQIGLLPAISFGMCYFFKFSPYQSLAILILSCSPGGAFSNFFTYWVNGDIALSILMTSTSSLLAFGGMPLNLWLYTSYWTEELIRVPYLNILISMGFVTAPAVIGMVTRHYYKVWANRISKICGVLGWVGALTCGVFLILIYWESIISTTLKMILAAAILPVMAFLIAYFIAKIFCMNAAVCRTIGIETSCQNSVVALNVILLSFPDNVIRKMIVYPTVYAICQLAEIFIVILIYQTYKFIHRDDVTEEDIKSVIDNTVLTIVPIPLQSREPKKLPASISAPDVLYNDSLFLERTSGKQLENNGKTYDERLALLKQNETNRISETYAYSQVPGPRVPDNYYPHFSQRHRRRTSSSSSEEDSQYMRLYNAINVPTVSQNSPSGDFPSRMDSWKMHPSGSLVSERPARSPEAVNVAANNFKINFDPETYEIPRSPSLNAGYSFRTFGNGRNLKN